MISAQEALQRLRAGNQRFVSGVRGHEAITNRSRRSELAAGQEPFAIILGCSDSRALVFICYSKVWLRLRYLFKKLETKLRNSSEHSI